MENEKRDYSLLRPATIEYIKAGGKICWAEDGDIAETFFTKDGKLVTCFSGETQAGIWSSSEVEMYFKQVPLCWVEGKPVYKGDVLYGIDSCSDLMYIAKEYSDGVLYTEDNDTDAYCEVPENLTWTKLVTKKKYWVNIYEDVFGYGDTVYCVKHETKEMADASVIGERIACVEIEM